MRRPPTPGIGSWPARSWRQWRAADRDRPQGRASAGASPPGTEPDGVKSYRAHAQRGFDRDMEVFHPEALQQPQNLNVFPAAGLDHPRFHQAAQGVELRRQVPFGQRRRLIQRADLLLDQRQVMDRVEDHVLAVITPWMAGDDLPAAADHDLIDIAPYPDIAMAVGDGHRIIVGLIANQRL